MFAGSRRGWFNMSSFEDLITNIFFPVAKDLPGKKILLGENLSSHIFLAVINKRLQGPQHRVCMIPPNTTHHLQPLDIGVYGVHSMD